MNLGKNLERNLGLQPRQMLHLVIWAYTALHLVVAAVLPLAAHEAHYALYARDLQLSYLDHPPMVAWLQALILPLSTADFALRVLPIGLSVVAQYLLAHLSRVLNPDGSPWLEVVCVLLLQGTLVFHIGMTMSPDAPLVPLGLAVVLTTARCLENDRWQNWLLLGVFIGLAGLAKYTAATLSISVLLMTLFARGAGVGTWLRMALVGATSLLLISPVLWWNVQHDWATIAFHNDYQFEDVQGWSVLEFFSSSAEQLLYYTPLLVIGGAVALYRTFKESRGRDWRRWLLPAFVVPVLLLYLAAALESRASPHWSMLGWILLIPLLGRWLVERWSISKALRSLTYGSAAYSILILVALLAAMIPVGRWPDYQHPLRAIAGWQEAAELGDELRRDLDRPERETEPVLLARNWHHAGLLAWYAPDTTVKNLFMDNNPHNFRQGVADHSTWGILVYPRKSSEPRTTDLTRDFDCIPFERLAVEYGDSLLQTFHYYECHSKLPQPQS